MIRRIPSSQVLVAATAVAASIAIASLPARTLHAQSAPHVAASLPPAELSALDAIRKRVWVDWFAGDTAALRRVLAPELIAISPDSRYWQTLDQTLASSAGFKAGGGRLVTVTFDSTRVHRFGETVVMFSRYALTTTSRGKRESQTGRATEVFVRSGGRWVHTSWHLDSDRQ